MAGYQPNKWEVYDQSIPIHKQPDALITKDKLINIEQGISNAVTDFQIGSVCKGTDVNCEIIADENNPSVKRINMVIPKEVSWLVSDAELFDQSVAPVGVSLNDIILDSKGNIYTIIKNSNDVYILNKRMNIKGQPGDVGSDGKPGIKWVFSDNNLVEGEAAPENAIIGDYILDNKGDVFETLEDFTLHKLLNIRGADGKEYYLEIGDVNVGDVASAEIVDHKLNLIIPAGPRGDKGEVGPRGNAGKSTYDLWKELGYEGDAKDFIEFLRGDENLVPIDSLDSTSTTEPLSANQGRILKNNRLTTLDDILANEEEGIFVDALAVKEMFLKLQEMITNIK